MPTISIGNASVTYTGQFLSLPFRADPITGTGSILAGVYAPGVGINHDNDIYFDCAVGNEKGILIGRGYIVGLILNPTFLNAIITSTGTLSGTAIMGGVNQGLIIAYGQLFADWWYDAFKKNWVAWTNIGEFSTTTRGRKNQSGEAPMDWPGWAFQAKKLGGSVVIYGENGITLMRPADEPVPTFGFKRLLNIGLMDQNAVAGNDYVHYFITKKRELWRLAGEQPEKLGYREIFSAMGSVVMLYDEEEERLYVGDGVKGYVFDEGLGGGLAEITGLSRGLMTSPSAITMPPLNATTDILDFGHRGLKTITFIEVGTDTSEDLYIAVDYRYNKTDDWSTSSWVLANPSGVARLTVAATEFRIKLKQLVHDPIRIDYINVRYQKSDRRFLRGPLYELGDQT